MTSKVVRSHSSAGPGVASAFTRIYQIRDGVTHEELGEGKAFG